MPRGEGWTRSGRLILFQLDNYPDRLDLNLYVGPGPAETRQGLIDVATENQPPFRVSKRKPSETPKFKLIFSRRLLRAEDYEDAALHDIESRIRTQWEDFADRDLPALVAPIQEAASSLANLLDYREATRVTTTEVANEAVSDRRPIPGAT